MERSKSAEDFIAKHPQWAELLTELRAVLRSTGLEEAIKWGVPVYTLDGKNIVGMAAFKKHAALWFHQGALLEDKAVIDQSVADHLKARFEAIGVTVKSVGVKDIILPGDMKELLGKVVEAEKAAQANVIRRREETNATRSLLNTAKVMETNAVALRLKEL